MRDNTSEVLKAMWRDRPRCVVELGTGDGATAAKMMAVLSADSSLTVVNWPSPPSGDSPHLHLAQWLSDPRLKLIFGDTREPGVVGAVPGGIDLLHVDSTHTRRCAEEEWRLYEPKLADVATVVFDDLDHNDMMEFWNRLVGDKEVAGDKRTVGVLRYKRHGTA